MTSDFVNQIIADPVSLNLMSQEELFGIDTETVAQFQLEVIRVGCSPVGIQCRSNFPVHDLSPRCA